MLYVQNRTDLTRALSMSAPYYENKASDSGMVTDYRDWQIPLGRRFRALKIWFVMRTYGVEGMREHIRRTVGLGELFAGLVKKRDDLFETVAPPQFALTCFRIKPEVLVGGASGRVDGMVANGSADPAFQPQKSAEEEMEQMANVLTKRMTELVNERGIFCTGSNAGGKTFLRIVSANANAEERYIREAWETIVEASEEVVREYKEGKGGTNGVVNSH